MLGSGERPRHELGGMFRLYLGVAVACVSIFPEFLPVEGSISGHDDIMCTWDRERNRFAGSRFLEGAACAEVWIYIYIYIHIFLAVAFWDVQQLVAAC